MRKLIVGVVLIVAFFLQVTFGNDNNDLNNRINPFSTADLNDLVPDKAPKFKI